MTPLRIASYNIHRCIGIDGRHRPDRIRQVINELDAQIIALQEVESGQEHDEVLDYLTRGTPWHVIEGPTLQRETGLYGNAVLTSLPVEDHALLDLTFHGREPRGAINLHVRYHNQLVRIIASHLGLLPGERRAQIRQLLNWMGSRDADPSRVTVLMGDLNEWYLWGRPLRWLRSWFGATPAPATFPTRWPIFALDRIWVHPRSYMINIAVQRTAMAREASDHYPIMATLAW